MSTPNDQQGNQDTLYRVFQKLSRMSETLHEIEDWLEARDKIEAVCFEGDGAARNGPLTLEGVDAAIHREERAGEAETVG